MSNDLEFRIKQNYGADVLVRKGDLINQDSGDVISENGLGIDHNGDKIADMYAYEDGSTGQIVFKQLTQAGTKTSFIFSEAGLSSWRKTNCGCS